MTPGGCGPRKRALARSVYRNDAKTRAFNRHCEPHYRGGTTCCASDRRQSRGRGKKSALAAHWCVCQAWEWSPAASQPHYLLLVLHFWVSASSFNPRAVVVSRLRSYGRHDIARRRRRKQLANGGFYLGSVNSRCVYVICCYDVCADTV